MLNLYKELKSCKIEDSASEGLGISRILNDIS